MSTHWARLACCLALAACATAQAPRFEVDQHGVVQDLSWGTEPSLQSVFLLVSSPGWGAAVFDQGGWQPDHIDRGPGTCTARGQQAFEGGSLELEETVSTVGDAVRIAFHLTCHGEVATEGVRLMVRAPAAGLAGKGRVLLATGRVAIATPLPAALPDPYHLTSATRPDWLAWQLGDDAVVVRPEGDWLGSVAVQDDRQFRLDSFEAQLAATGTQQLRDGQEVRCEVVVERRSMARLAAEGTVVVEGGSMWDTARVEVASTGELSLGEPSWSATEGPRWRPVELRCPVGGTWDNPFDPAQIDVRAVVETPSGHSLEQPAFIWQDYESVSDGAAVLTPRGGQEWRVRWTPQEEGRYRVHLEATNKGHRAATAPVEFLCRGQDGRGFVRRCPDTPYYLQFDDGSPYFAVGENICWDGDELVQSYRRWFARLGAAGGNYCRIWLCRWNMALEWTNTDPSHRGCYSGLGRYSLDNAWRLDQVLRAAADNGIKVMLCLGYHGELQDTEDYFHADCWATNPYNQANGGPCAKPAEFWTNETARAMYQRRLRYYLARWGADPTILSFEFWNEVNAPAPWIDEMARYLGDHDVHRHLRTTTYGGDATWQLASMDYSQAHHYGSDDNLVDSAPIIADQSYDWTERYGKPFMMGEFGIDWKTSDSHHDPQGHGTNLHNGIWAAVASRSFGTAALWYWDDYVDRLDQYHQFTSVARFAEQVDWTHFRPSRPVLEPARYVDPPPPAFEPLALHPESNWRRQPDGEVTVSHDGALSGGTPAQFLFSPGKPEVSSPLRLRLAMPAQGEVKVLVRQVSARAVLVASVDGQEVARREFVCGPPGEGRYKSTEYAEQWRIWQSTFDEEFAFAVPAGSHLVELSNVEGDWMTIPEITIPGYRDATLPNLDIWLLADEHQAIGWLHDRASTWQADRDGRAPAQQSPLHLAFTGLADGRYEASWWDTWQGEPAGSATVQVVNGRVELTTPAFTRDLALFVRSPAR